MKGHTKHSRKIPYWLWFLIAKSLGIKLHPNDKPLLAILLHAITLFSGGGMLLTRIWFSGYDISSHTTETDILDGIVAIIIVSLFVCLGIYAQKLAHRVFEHPKLLEMMRLHSKTIAKINAAVLAILVLGGFVVVLNLATINYAYWDLSPEFSNSSDPDEMNPCQTVEIPLLICQFYFFSQVIFSVFFLLWNALVGAALICVARTHTIAIRRFICQLECDAYLRDTDLRKTLYSQDSQESRDSLKMYSWDNELPRPKMENKTEVQEASDSVLDDENTDNVTFDQRVQLELTEDAPDTREVEDGGAHKNIRRRFFTSFRRLSEHDESSAAEENTFEPKVLNDEELLHKYWRHVVSF